MLEKCRNRGPEAEGHRKPVLRVGLEQVVSVAIGTHANRVHRPSSVPQVSDKPVGLLVSVIGVY